MVDVGADRGVAFVWTTRTMLAAFHLGRSLNKRQRLALGFTKGVTPCHATLTETLRAIDGRSLAQALGAVCFAEGEDQRHIAIDGKTMRASKDGDGHATHVLSAFCAGLQSILGNEASRGKGMENSRCIEASGPARFEGQNRHRRRDVLSKIDRGEDRRERRRLRVSGKRQSEEDLTGEYRNGFQ